MRSGKKRILFICINNSVRSQIAEGLVNHKKGDSYKSSSAGTHPLGVNPYAIEVMKEVGIDISDHRSKGSEEFRGREFDLVVTVCGDHGETCPSFSGGKRYVHRGFKDPEITNDREETLSNFRDLRDDIDEWLDSTLM